MNISGSRRQVNNQIIQFAPFDSPQTGSWQSAQGRRPAEIKVEVIVSFLALLELVKRGAVAAEQHDQHGDIRISHTETSTVPQYG